MTNEKAKKLRAGVFIDGSNLFWAMNKKNSNGESVNYKISFGKLKDYLKKRFSPVFYQYYACEDDKPSSYSDYEVRAQGQKKFHQKLEGLGYTVIRKSLKHLNCGSTKCDMDVEIAMAMHKYIDDYDLIILISGDSDFHTAIETFHGMGKSVRIFSFSTNLSWELREFAIKNPRSSFKLFDDLKSEIEF
jgi:uncharacterized LabA/DUF88 family protein